MLAHNLHRSVAPDDWQALLELGGESLLTTWDSSGRQVYTSTLDRYRATFGHPAPANVWHDPRLTPGRTLNNWLMRHARTLISVTLAGVLALLAVNHVLPAGVATLLGFILLAAVWEVPGRQGSATARRAVQSYSPYVTVLGAAAAMYGGGPGNGGSDSGCGDGGSGGSC